MSRGAGLAGGPGAAGAAGAADDERNARLPHAVLLGPTASGKSALALALARRYPGVEIVSADAFAVYRQMDVGTAKIAGAARTGIALHMIDLVDPTEDFTVAAYQAAAGVVLAEIDARGATALVTGGTGLYLRALTDGLDIPGRWPEVARHLGGAAEREGAVALHARLAALDPLAASRIDPANVRRTLRALEVTLGSGRPFSSFGPGLGTYPPSRYPMVGLRVGPDLLDARIERRFDEQLRAGFLEEVARLAAVHGALSRSAAAAIGYRELAAHLAGGMTLAEAREEALRRSQRLARRQMRWWRRDPRIDWIDAGEEDGDGRPPESLMAAAAQALGWS